MKYLYDAENDVLTIQLIDGRYVESEEVWPGVVVDFDGQGRPVAFDFTEKASSFVDVGGLEPGAWRRVASSSARPEPQPVTPEELRTRREALGLTQAQLGKFLGKPTNTIARWERGELRVESPLMLAAALAGLERAVSDHRRRAPARVVTDRADIRRVPLVQLTKHGPARSSRAQGSIVSRGMPKASRATPKSSRKK
jgi:transcriptional regulator with XRE-family HTH domain